MQRNTCYDKSISIPQHMDNTFPQCLHYACIGIDRSAPDNKIQNHLQAHTNSPLWLYVNICSPMAKHHYANWQL